MNVTRLADSFRQKFPQKYRDKTDKEIIDDLRTQGFNVPSYEQSVAKTVYKTPGYDRNDLKNIKTESSYVNNWFVNGDFIPESFKEKGFAGISPEFFKQAYNDSMAGKAFKAANGFDKYDVDEEYDPSWYAQAGQFLVGMASPLEVGVMIGTGAVGKLASGALRTGLFGHGVADKFLKNGIFGSIASRNPKMGTVAQNMIDGAVSMGIGGGGFTAAHVFTEDVANQRMAYKDVDDEGNVRGIGDVNVSRAMKKASNEMLHSLPMFAVAGGVTQGMMGSLYGYAQSYMKKDSFARKLALASSHPAARVGEEAALFTAMPTMLGEEGAPKLGSQEFWQQLGMNTVVVGGMRAVGAFTEDRFFDAKKFLKSEMALESRVTGNMAKSGKRVLDNLPADAPAPLRDMIRKNLIDESNLKVAFKEADKALDTIMEMNRNFDNPNFLKNAHILGTRENKLWGEYADLASKYSLLLKGTVDNALNSNGKPRIRESFKEYFGREPKNQNELNRFERNLKRWDRNIQKSIDWMNEYQTADWTNSKSGVSQDKGQSAVLERRPTRIDGDKREVALQEWGNDAILKYAKKANLEKGVDFKVSSDGIVIGKERVINRIYNIAKENKLLQEEKLIAQAKPFDDLTAEIQSLKKDVQKITGEVTYPEVENIVLKQKLLNRNEQSIPIVNTASISDVHKNLLAYNLSLLPKSRSHRKAANETIGLMKYVEKEKKFQGKNINELSADQKANLAKDYIQDKLGVDIYDGKALKKLKLNERQLKRLAAAADNARDALAISFRHGELKKIVGNIVENVGKFNPKGERKVIITGGAKSYKKMKDFALTKNTHEYAKGQNISGEGANLALKVAIKFKARPEEIANFKVSDIDVNTGVIGFKRSKREAPTYITDKNLAQDLINYADSVGKKGAVELFPFKTAANFSKFTKYFTKEIGEELRVEHRLIGKDYAWEGMIPGEKTVGNIEIPARKASYRLQAGRLFRGDYGDSAIQTGQVKQLSLEKLAAQMGHTSTKATPTYLKKLIPPKSKKKAAKRLPEEMVFQSKGDKVIRDKFIDKVMKKNKLSEAQLKREGLDKGVLGEFGEGVIKLQKGLWQPADFYHENLHRLKAFARASNNKGLTKLIERGEKLAINTKEYKAWKKKNPNRDAEEFLADIVGGKASRMDFSKGMLNKIGQFVKQLVSKVKVAFGAGNFNDISRVLAKRVQKGFSTEGIKFAKGQVKYRLEQMSPEQSLKYANDVFDQLFKEKLTGSQRKDMIRYIGSLGQLGDNFKLGKGAEIAELQQFVGTIGTLDKSAIRNMPNSVEKFRLFRDVEKLRLQKNVTESERITLLKDLEVKNGDIFKASNRQLKDFMEIVNTKDDWVKSETKWLDDRIASQNLNKDVADRFKLVSNVKWALPITTVLESVGLKRLANRMRTHTSTEIGHIGKFSDYERKMKALLGNRKWEKYQDMTYLFDKERYFERLEKGYLSKAEKQFVKDAIDLNKWNKEKKWTYKNTKEGKVLEGHKELMDYYKNELVGKDGILKNILNDAEYEKFMADKNIEWLKKDVYVQRRLTKEFKKHYRPEQQHFEKLVEAQTEAVAKNLTKRHFGDKKYTKEEFNNKMIEFRDDANSIAINELYEMFKFSPGKYSPSFLKKRHVKLPEKILIDGKMIDVYETKFGLTTKDYAIGQAKFLANIEYFPEFIKIKGFNMKGERKLLGEISMKDRALGDWTEKRIKEHLKIDREYTDYPDGIRLVRHTTSVMAKMQLSFPTSGLKNFLVGSTQSLLAFRLRDFFMGFVDIINKDNRAMVRATGATEVGLRHISMKGVAGVVDKIADKGFFRFGLMRPSEDLNRFVSVLAGKRDQANLVRRIKFGVEGSKSYKRAENRLKRFYHLDSKEISLLKQFGLNGVKGQPAQIAGRNKRNVDNLYQKMNTYAHINTQGAAINLFMPDWAGAPLAQSALLYKRMAYHATVNTVRNTATAIQNKSYLAPIMFGLGAYLSGNTLIYFYDKVLGQSVPGENSNEWNTFRTIMWKGEFLGIVSEYLNPWRDEGLGMSMYPAVLSTIGVTANALLGIAKGEKFAGQGIEEILKGSASLYNNTSKLLKQGYLNPDSYPSQSKRFRKLYYDMLKEYGDRDEISAQNSFKADIKRSKYMQAFWNVFESGKKTDLMGNSIGKWYMMSLLSRANDYYYRGIDEDGLPILSHEDALRKAVSTMKRTVTGMNPNKAKINAKTLRGAAKQIPKSMQFIKWLDRNEPLSKELAKLENQYGARVRMMNESIAEYLKSANLEKDLKHYGISIGQLFFK